MLIAKGYKIMNKFEVLPNSIYVLNLEGSLTWAERACC